MSLSRKVKTTAAVLGAAAAISGVSPMAETRSERCSPSVTSQRQMYEARSIVRSSIDMYGPKLKAMFGAENSEAFVSVTIRARGDGTLSASAQGICNGKACGDSKEIVKTLGLDKSLKHLTVDNGNVPCSVYVTKKLD